MLLLLGGSGCGMGVARGEVLVGGRESLPGRETVFALGGCLPSRRKLFNVPGLKSTDDM